MLEVIKDHTLNKGIYEGLTYLHRGVCLCKVLGTIHCMLSKRLNRALRTSSPPAPPAIAPPAAALALLMLWPCFCSGPASDLAHALATRAFAAIAASHCARAPALPLVLLALPRALHLPVLSFLLLLLLPLLSGQDL